MNFENKNNNRENHYFNTLFFHYISFSFRKLDNKKKVVFG